MAAHILEQKRSASSDRLYSVAHLFAKPMFGVMDILMFRIFAKKEYGIAKRDLSRRAVITVCDYPSNTLKEDGLQISFLSDYPRIFETNIILSVLNELYIYLEGIIGHWNIVSGQHKSGPSRSNYFERQSE